MNKRISLHILVALILSATVISCSHTYFQVYNTACKNCVSKDTSLFVGGDDSVSVEYYFWREDGIMSFVVENKSSQPIYVDWRKSIFYRNNEPFVYWKEISTGHTESIQTTRYYPRNGVSKGLAATVIEKTERVTFVIPYSKMSAQPIIRQLVPQTILLDFDNLTTKSTITRYNKDYTVYNRAYKSEKVSPFVFRNYISWTNKEDGADVHVIDNTFFVTSVQEMRSDIFVGQVSASSPTKFYKIITKEGHSLEDRERGIYPY